ncbi:metal ABC transporter substrate-binding protein [Roseateles sp. BYS180W]|uniref:Metal ABC transporter substrate-binding protein n=1 Tax=Roseateles rivi TaxID=3299028 RepID=A0ABW7FQR4_9BURK
MDPMRFDATLKRAAAAALALLGTALATPAAALTVFACEPEWAALTRVLLPSARVHVATHAEQDPHHIEARPALIAQLRAAEVVVCTGASLEGGWLPTLQERAGNARAREVFFAAAQVSLLNPQPSAIGTPWAGDVHAEGNPHVHLDPRRLLQVTAALAQRLGQEAPAERAGIEQRRAAFEARWRQHIAAWERSAAPLRGQRVAAQHTSFAYLWHWLEIKQDADLEPKPGMAPTPGHLQRLLEGLRSAPPMAVVASNYQDPRSARWLTTQLESAKVKVPLLVLPATVAEDAAEPQLVQWMDTLVRQLLQAAKP